MGHHPELTLTFGRAALAASRVCFDEAVTTAAAINPGNRLSRPRTVVLSGVCAGLAEHLHRPVGWVRAWAIALSFCGGAGVLLYLWLWALTPLRPVERDDPGVRRAIPVAVLLLAGAAASVLFSLTLAAGSGLVVLTAAATLILAIVALAWNAIFDRRDPHHSVLFRSVIRWALEAVLFIAGLLVLLSSSGRTSVGAAIVAVLMIAGAAASFAAPLVIKSWSERMVERTARVRALQRAEIAAHLHDSVLQTLALIQNRAGASTEVARLARAQERELRDWLFAGTTPTGSDLASELRDAAAAIELEYPARVEVVVVGEALGFSNSALFAAAKEAMVNAARHAGGEISVYLELTASTVDIFVRDRGAGFDVATLPGDRLGVKESIVGRMARAGGSSKVGPGLGGIGTEIQLHLPVGDERA